MIFSLWDLGGSHDARTFWRFYYEDTQAIIFVIDSSDLERMDEAREVDRPNDSAAVGGRAWLDDRRSNL